MISKGMTSTVNFYVVDTAGLPVTGKALSISASISINGNTATSISDTISEIDSINLPGWYRFNHQFSTVGNVFIFFSCMGCNISPWEDVVVEMSAGSYPSATDIATAVWSDSNVYVKQVGITQKGYLVEHPGDNVWNYPTSNLSVTYGNRVEATAKSTEISKISTKINSVESSVLNWAVANNVLTLYDEDNNVLGTFNLTRDSDGNIIRVQPSE